MIRIILAKAGMTSLSQRSPESTSIGQGQVRGSVLEQRGHPLLPTGTRVHAGQIGSMPSLLRTIGTCPARYAFRQTGGEICGKCIIVGLTTWTSHHHQQDKTSIKARHVDHLVGPCSRRGYEPRESSAGSTWWVGGGRMMRCW